MEEARKNLSKAEVGHIDANAPETMPGYMLIPGDPNRVSMMAELWDEGARVERYAREFRGAYGTYKGCEIGAYNTGIGGPSAEYVLNNLMGAGAHTFIRVGTCGCIQDFIQCGDIIINDSNIRLDGTSDLYIMKEYPAAASYEVTLALIQACETLGLRYHVGTGCTSGSFFTGQCRTAYGGYRPSHVDHLYEDLRQARVLNFEMEGATVTTLARLLGKRAGVCATVVSNRVTGEWREDPEFEQRASLVGCEAIRILTEWDRKKKQNNKECYFPGL